MGSDLRLLSWNINGISRKKLDTEFINCINQYDIIFLSETWISKHTCLNLDINNYICEHITGNKAHNTKKGRYSGLSIYYHQTLSKYLEIVEKNQHGILWITLSKELFD